MEQPTAMAQQLPTIALLLLLMALAELAMVSLALLTALLQTLVVMSTLQIQRGTVFKNSMLTATF